MSRRRKIGFLLPFFMDAAGRHAVEHNGGCQEDP